MLLLACAVLAAGCHRAPEPPTAFTEQVPGLGYTNQHAAGGPWSLHVIRVDRGHPELRFTTAHAHNGALGLDTLSRQVAAIPATAGIPVAAINGDFYQRERAHAGDPRGLQIAAGELLSAPQDRIAFWISTNAVPRTGPVASRFRVTWPDGSESPFGLNEEQRSNAVVLFTTAAGTSTHATGGPEILLEPELEGVPAAPAPGARIRARVREVRTEGNSPIAPGTWVLSLAPRTSHAQTPPAPGSNLTLSFESDPDLTGVRTGIGGGPILVREGRAQRIHPPSKDAYEFSSMLERHPRSALGWNPQYFFLVEVDGRQPGLSVGMTLDELADYMAGLGCTDALNLDGGGSATLWAAGRIRNSPCDGRERPIANSLVVVRAPAP
ncbi:MAG: phosphodiester glycosidase family protein [Verrucomicrobiales bacterium]|nr:phosphodiester glycosidase family protein [Verrucomicrobiales bacterium]